MKVIISATLRTFFGRIAETEIQGNSIGEILRRITEEYPEEDEKRRKFYEAGMEYTQYCQEVELKRIKDLLK